MRRGIYAVVDGVEYEASLHAGGVSIYIPGTLPRPEGWEPGRRGSRGRALPLDAVSEAYEILTDVTLEEVAVYVDRVDYGYTDIQEHVGQRDPMTGNAPD